VGVANGTVRQIAQEDAAGLSRSATLVQEINSTLTILAELPACRSTASS